MESKIGKVGKLENYKTFEEMRSQSKERLCKSIIQALARRNREKQLIVTEVEEETQDVICIEVTPVDTKWVDTDTAFEGEPMQIRSRIVAREIKSDERPDVYAGLFHWRR